MVESNRLKIRLLISILCLAAIAQAKDQTTTAVSYWNMAWSVRMATSEMSRHAAKYSTTWDYVPGTVLKGFEQLWSYTKDTAYFKYIQSTVDAVIPNSNGNISGYNGTGFSSYTLDNINEGKAVLLMYNKVGSTKYKTAVDTLRKQLSVHPRVNEGGFWHKKAYPNQMWLDGIYMASPFLAEYGKVFGDTAAFTDAIQQFTIMETHARDSVTGLLYHGWDATRTRAWANSTTGCSPSFWGRSIGWYAVALVDALDHLPGNHIGRPKLIAILQRLAVSLQRYQDTMNGTWYQVVDKGSLTNNWRESSASCMFVYAIAKGIRMGYIDSSYLPVARKGYSGIINEFITLGTDSMISLTGICSSAGLDTAINGPRDGSYDYYVNYSGTQPVTNDGKGTGPFLMASVEMEQAGFILPPLTFQAVLQGSKKVQLMWKDRTYNATSFIVERKTAGDAAYSQVGEAAKGTASFVDSLTILGTQYFYRLRAKAGTSYSDYSNSQSVTTLPATSIHWVDVKPQSSRLMQNFPNPFNPSTTITFIVGTQGFVSLRIFDVLGREVAVLVDASLAAGNYAVQWNAGNAASGIYYCRLTAKDYSDIKKIILLR